MYVQDYLVSGELMNTLLLSTLAIVIIIVAVLLYFRSAEKGGKQAPSNQAVYRSELNGKPKPGAGKPKQKRKRQK